MCRTFAGAEVRFEVCWKKFECALDRWTRHGDQVTEAFTFIEGQDFAELVENRLAALASLDFLDHHRQGVCFHAAGGALTARFHRKKVGNLNELFDDAGILGHQFYNAAPQSRASVTHRVMIQRCVDLLYREKGR